MLSRFPVAFRLHGVRFLAILCPPRTWAFLAVGLPAREPGRTPTGLSRFARLRFGRGGCPLYPGDSGAHTTGRSSPAAACRIPAAESLDPNAASHHRGFF